MLAAPLALWEEWAHANTMAQQVQAHPERVIGISLLILIATCVPVFRCGGGRGGRWWLRVAEHAYATLHINRAMFVHC